MKHWIDTFPHKVYASVLILEEKVIDWKIGERYWTHPFGVTLKGQITVEDLSKCTTKYKEWTVNSMEEHEEVFKVLAKKWIQNIRENENKER